MATVQEIIDRSSVSNPTAISSQSPTAPGGMSTLPGGAASGAVSIPTVSRPVTTTIAPTQATVSSPAQTGETVAETFARGQQVLAGLAPLPGQTATDQTVGESLGFANPTFESMPTFEEIYGKPIDEESVTRNQMKLFQGQIDATNQIYDQMLNEARLEGQGRLGSQRAMAARGGLLGSDFGASQKQKVQDFNTDINRGIQAERSAAIGSIMGTMRNAVQQQLSEKRAARQQGAENYLNYLKNESTIRQGNIGLAAQSLLSQGIDPSTLDENELAAIANEAGVSTGDIITQYQTLAASQKSAQAEADLETRKTEAEINKINADIEQGKVQTIGEGTMLYNTETGEFFKNPKTYAPTAASGLKIGAGSLNQEAVADVHATLQESRGQDGYADTGKYLAELEGFVALGGDPKDFIKEYDPDIYINPNDPTRSFLQSQMKKPASDNLFLGALGGIDINSAIAEASSGG